MADLTVRRGRGPGASLAQNDPFQMVRESMRRMQDLFRDSSFDVDPLAYLEAGRMTQFVPDFEVRERKDGLVFSADLPGVKEDDLEITVEGNRLRISGHREFDQETRGDTWYAAERSYGSFTRTFILPEGVDTDNVDANLDNGVLTVKLGKRVATQPRRISLGGRQPAIEGQYSQGPFHQSQAGQNVGQKDIGGQPQNVGGQNVGKELGGQDVGGQQNLGQGVGQQQGKQGYGGGYGGMYGQTPEASGEKGYGAAAGQFEHGEQAGTPKAGKVGQDIPPPKNTPDKS